MHLFFVCTGNICRSPTAERLALAYAAELQIEGFAASSAGIRAVIGHPIHSAAALVLESLGADAADFAARQFTPKIAAESDLVITMTTAHRDAVLERAPRLLRRTFTLSEVSWLVSEGGAATIGDLPDLRTQSSSRDLTDVEDPIGRSSEVFERVGLQIADLLRPILHLCQRSA